MKLHIIAIRDTVADVYAQPQFVLSLGGAVRSFGDECQRKAPDNIMNQHPEHFEIYHLGSYDDSNAKFEITEPKQLATGANYVK